MAVLDPENDVAPRGSGEAAAERPPLSGESLASVSIVLPCLNEIASVAGVVQEAFVGLRYAGVHGEVIVVDNGSTDGSAAAADRAGAIVLGEPRRGYGAAVRRGLWAARGDVIILADADGTYDLRELGALVASITRGAELVVGSRFGGSLEDGAMPWLHRHVGTPALNLLLRAATGHRFSDSQSGFRALRRDRLPQLGLEADGMELASEMLVRAHRAELRIEQLPVRYRRRQGTSKLRPLSDGLRHTRLLFQLARENPQVVRKTRYRSSS